MRALRCKQAEGYTNITMATHVDDVSWACKKAGSTCV